MHPIRFLVPAAIVITFSCSNVWADFALQGTTTDPSGITGLVVDGTTYNVSFLTGTYDSVYTSPPTFLGNATGATDASVGLASALNTLGVVGLLGNDCITHGCQILTPYLIDNSNSPPVMHLTVTQTVPSYTTGWSGHWYTYLDSSLATSWFSNPVEFAAYSAVAQPIPTPLVYTPAIPAQSSVLPVSSLPSPNGFIQSIGSFLQSAKAGFSAATQSFLDAKQATVDFLINDPFPTPIKTAMNVAGTGLQAASFGVNGALAVANFSSGLNALQNIPGSELEQAFYFAGAAKGFSSLLPSATPNPYSFATLAAQATWTVATGANPTTLLLSLDATLAGIVGGQLLQLAQDPPTNDYQSVYVAYIATVPDFVSGIGQDFDLALKNYTEQLIRAATFLEAANKTFDRYTAAYNAGDSASAMLQILAFVDYLDQYNKDLTNATQLSSEMEIALVAHGFVDNLANLGDLQNDLATIKQFGFSPEFVSDLDSLGYSSADIDQLFSLVQSLDLSSGGGSSLLGMLDTQRTEFESVLYNINGSVPEPATLILLGIGLVGLGFTRLRRR